MTRHPIDYFVTRRVLINYNRLLGRDPEKPASLHEIFPRFRASISVPSAWVAELLSDPRRYNNPEGTFWLGTDGAILWVMVERSRLISVISLTAEQKAFAQKAYGEAMAKRDAHLRRVEEARRDRAGSA